MKQISLVLPRFINMLKTYRLLLLISIWGISMNAQFLSAQNTADDIRELKEGFLIIRFPSYKAKIDMLQAMAKKEDHPVSQKRIQKLLDEAMYDRDTVRLDFIRAFRDAYDFSKVAYSYDHDGDDLAYSDYFLLDGTPVSKNDLTSKPVYFLHFERTGESKIDGMVIYNAGHKKIPSPFPNDFSRNAFNLSFLGLGKSNAVRRVAKINKRLHKYWEQVN